MPGKVKSVVREKAFMATGVEGFSINEKHALFIPAKFLSGPGMAVLLRYAGIFIQYLLFLWRKAFYTTAVYFV